MGGSRLGNQHDLADVAPFGEPPVRVGGPLERVHAVDAGLDVARMPPGHERVEFFAQQVGPVPQVAEVHAADGTVAVHEAQRREHRYAGELTGQPGEAAPVTTGQVGEAVGDELPDRAQQSQAALPVAATERVEDEVDALAAGQVQDPGDVVLGAVVDRVRAALLPENVVLGGGCGTEGHHPRYRAAQLQHRDADTAGGHVHEDPLTGAHVRHAEQHVEGGEVVDRDGGRLGEAQRFGQFDDLGGRGAHQFGVAAEAHQGDYPPTHGVTVQAGADGGHHARHLVAHHAGRFPRVGVEPLPRHDLGEVEPGGVYADAHLASTGYRVRRLADLKHLGAAGPPDPHRSHPTEPSPVRTGGPPAGRIGESRPPSARSWRAPGSG